eukprot:11559266-Alexandrium_andersonii.AAC.1
MPLLFAALQPTASPRAGAISRTTALTSTPAERHAPTSHSTWLLCRKQRSRSRSPTSGPTVARRP